MGERVLIREVGPRDGFQNEPEIIPTADKVRLVEMLARTGVPRLEVTSFVRADVIPQLADGPEVLRAADIPDDVSVTVLIPNERGLENALELRDRFDEVNLFLSASESHNRANVNRSVEESLSGLERVVSRAREEGLPTSSSEVSSRRTGRGGARSSATRARKAYSNMTMLDFMSNTPGPNSLEPSRRTGIPASVPTGQTVSK